MTLRMALRTAAAALARWILWLALGLGGLAMTQAEAAPSPLDSARAHFVQAELLAHQGQLGPAREALAQAERLAPGLPFARPEAVHNLHRALALPRDPGAPAHGGSMPWAVPCALAAGALAAWLLMRLGQPPPASRNDTDMPATPASPAGWAVPGMNTMLPRGNAEAPTAAGRAGAGFGVDELGPWDDGAVGGGNSDWVA